MTTPTRLILVTGATGAQGGATTRQLLAHGYAVRFLTRRTDSPQAHELIQLGAEAVAGDFDDPGALRAASRGVNGVFSVQVPDTSGTDSERRHGFALIEAAVSNGVTQFVHTSVSCAGRHESFPGWQEGRWTRKYWTDKWDIEQAVRAAQFQYWTVLRPAFLMDNFAQPKASGLFPHLAAGEIATALRLGSRMQLIAADDIGTFACAAFENPSHYHGQNIELAAEALTMPEVARILTDVTGRRVVVAELTAEQALARGLFPGWVRSQEWSNEVGYCAHIPRLARYGIALTSFEQWARAHRDQIVIAN
ncbi:MAG: NmrA/HSCARG family protein [Sinobacteraceae bacterium]|nr:NmrA/HSCARG family protein [Nevskiaceae bacterium]